MKSKKILILLFVSLPVLIFGRFIQLFTLIDPDTGFFLDNQVSFNVFISILLAAVPLLLIIFSFIKNDYAEKITFQSAGFGVVSLLFGFVFLIEAAYVAVSGQLLSVSDATGYTVFSLQKFFYLLLCILCALCFCLQAVGCFSRVERGRFLLIFPVITWIYRLITTFINFTGIANISENIIEIFMLCASLLFLLAQGKAINQIDCRKNLRAATAFGTATACLCAVSTIPRYILLFINRSDLLHEGKTGNILDFALFLYCLFFLFFAMQKEKSSPEI